MSKYKLVTVHDFYAPSHKARIRCVYINGVPHCSKRQKRDAFRRAGVTSGSVLRSEESDIYIYDEDGRPCDVISGC